MDNIIKLDYNKIKELIKIAKEENISIINKKKNKTILLKKNIIIKLINKKKNKKILESKKKLKPNMKSTDILKLNINLINDLKKMEDIEDSISSIDEESLRKFPIDYSGFISDFISSDSTSYIESFTN